MQNGMVECATGNESGLKIKNAIMTKLNNLKRIMMDSTAVLLISVCVSTNDW